MRKPAVSKEWTIRPIGVVRSSIKKMAEAPKQGALAGTEAEIAVDPEFAEALSGLTMRVTPSDRRPRTRGMPGKAGRIIVLCWMHRADRDRLKVHPRGRQDVPERGVFGTRSPHRPNPISLHTVELVSVLGNVLRVRGMDAVDGTPVLDIKPHVPEWDG